MGILTRLARSKLLRKCEAHGASLRHRDDSYDGSTDEICEGVRVAQKAIDSVKAVGGVRAYLDSVDAELLRAMGGLNAVEAGDDEGWRTGGVATLRRDVETVRRSLLWLPAKCAVLIGGVAVVVWWIWFRR